MEYLLWGGDFRTSAGLADRLRQAVRFVSFSTDAGREEALCAFGTNERFARAGVFDWYASYQWYAGVYLCRGNVVTTIRWSVDDRGDFSRMTKSVGDKSPLHYCDQPREGDYRATYDVKWIDGRPLTRDKSGLVRRLRRLGGKWRRIWTRLARDLEDSDEWMSRVGIDQVGRRSALVYFEGERPRVALYYPGGRRAVDWVFDPYWWANHLEQKYCRCVDCHRGPYAKSFGIRWLC
jgi:hypothetical protein